MHGISAFRGRFKSDVRNFAQSAIQWKPEKLWLKSVIRAACSDVTGLDGWSG